MIRSSKSRKGRSLPVKSSRSSRKGRASPVKSSRSRKGRASPVKSNKKTKVSFTKSPNKNKKYMATFIQPNGHVKHVNFGASGYQNYGGVGKSRHLSESRKKAYIKRHSARENFNDPLTPGSLSRWCLWNKKTFSESVKDYKKRFHFV